MSPNGENEFFCDGITEEIIHALGEIAQLKVISRTSSFFFKDQKASVQEIASRLGVSVIIEGSVRLGGALLRISASMIRVEDEARFWSQTWDRRKDHIFEVQDEISLLIADALRENMGHLEIDGHLVDNPTQDVDAYEEYLNGRILLNKWNPTDVNLALQHFEKVLSLDEGLIDAHIGLADGYSFLAVAGFAPREKAWAKAAEAIKTAQKLDPGHAGLNYILANEAFFTATDYVAATNYALASLARRPNYAEAHRFLSFLYGLAGTFTKSYEHLLYVKSIDPLNKETRFYEAYYHYRTGNLPKAQGILDELLAENPKNLPALVVSIYILIHQEAFEEAKALLAGIPEELIAPQERQGIRCLIGARQGHPDEALLAELEAQAVLPESQYAHSYLFLSYAVLGQNDDAFRMLEKLFEVRSSVLQLSFSDPLVASLREDARYAAYQKRVYPRMAPKRRKKEKKASAYVLDPEEAQAMMGRVHAYIETDRPYLNPALTLRLLANQVDIHPNQLSWLLNEHVGQNFNEFVNTFRVEHFKALVLDPSNSHISLVGLAYESGFNSKTVFNAFFKKTVGMTPRQFQKSQA